jgi:ABC-2 type transport system ATP-binding protein
LNGRLECNSIIKQYKDGRTALKSVTFDIKLSGIFALIGRNGAGKTTLVRILATELLPTSGMASLDGNDIIRDAKNVREIMAIVPQEARPIQWMTPRQTIISSLLWRGFGYGDSRKRADDVLDQFGLTGYKDKPNRFLSGGIKRKMLVATALASEARIIFLDEPTTGLDPISRKELWDVLNEQKKKRFIFLTTHYLEEAEALADSIGILENGELLAIGTMEELRSKVRYPYTVRVNGGMDLTSIAGVVIQENGGYQQIMTSKEEAYSISKRLIQNGVTFSISPVSLNDIFFFFAKRRVDGEKE